MEGSIQDKLSENTCFGRKFSKYKLTNYKNMLCLVEHNAEDDDVMAGTHSKQCTHRANETVYESIQDNLSEKTCSDRKLRMDKCFPVQKDNVPNNYENMLC